MIRTLKIESIYKFVLNLNDSLVNVTDKLTSIENTDSTEYRTKTKLDSVKIGKFY